MRFICSRESKQTEHASGQKMVDRLIEAFVNRGQQHFELDHFAEARTDARLAKQLGGRQTKIVQLLQKIDKANPHRQLNQQSVIARAKNAPMNDGS